MAEAETAVVELGRVEGIDTAEELLLRLRTAADEHGDVEIDGSAVISLDSTTLQMLVAFRRDMLAEGAQVQWRGASAKLKKTAGLLGLAEELNL
jgi:anti-anti-sigma regulatory factor